MMSIRTKPQDLIRTCRWGLLGWGPLKSYRFSAFWLRSKCSICSYQLNIWYVPHVGTSILNWFLQLGEMLGACTALATSWPGIAVPPGSAHSPFGEKKSNKWKNTPISVFSLFLFFISLKDYMIHNIFLLLFIRLYCIFICFLVYVLYTFLIVVCFVFTIL